MISIQNIFKAPTQEQRTEIRLLCKKGQSNSYFDYLLAPLQALTSITMAFKDIPCAPIRGLLNSVTHLSSFSLRNAIMALADGIAISIRSFFQVAIIASAVTLGTLLPRVVYRNLEKLNCDGISQERQIIDLKQTLRTALESKIQEEQKFSELQDQFKDKTDEFAGLQTKFDNSYNITLQTNDFNLTLKSEIEKKETQLINIQQELESKTKELDSIKVATVDRTTSLFTIDSLQKQLELKDLKSDVIQKELNDLQSELKKSKENLAKFERDSKEREVVLKEFNDKIDSKEFELTKFKDKIASTEEDKKNAENELSKVSQAHEIEKILKQEQESISNDLQIQLSEKTSQIVTLKNEVETLETKLLNFTTSAPKENDEALVIIDKLSHAEELCTNLQKELQEKNQKINQLTNETVLAREKVKNNNDRLIDSQTNQQKLIEAHDKNESHAKKKYDGLLKKYSQMKEVYQNTFDELESLKSKQLIVG
ncbi:MAG: hypothetical protein H0W50_02015 [Parachlamydiaceae bacterium]|nr:hypothetical protein [Parachlamydiaceae bacterium]